MSFGRGMVRSLCAKEILTRIVPSNGAVPMQSSRWADLLQPVLCTQKTYATDSNHPETSPESGKMQSSSPVTKVLFDGDCKLCSNEIRLLEKFAKDRPIDFIDITETQYNPNDHQGITYEMAMKELHVVGPDNKVYTQAEAVRQMYTASGLDWLASLTRVPGIRQIADKLYLQFAQYRLARALKNCESGTCSVKLQALKKKLDKTA